MPQYSAQVTRRAATALLTPSPSPQPAGGWGTWISPVQNVGAYRFSTGATIYTVTSADITKLKNPGLISDETAVIYRQRLANPLSINPFTASANISLLSGARLIKAIANLQLLGLIKRFSFSTVTITWVKTSITFPEAQIRANWRDRLSNDNTYVLGVLNFLRGNSTTSTIDFVNLFPSWSITPQILGEALAHYASAKINVLSVSATGDLSLEWNPPILSTGISREELVSLYKGKFIGEAFYNYVALRSEKVGLSQVVSIKDFCTRWECNINKSLEALVRFSEQNLISNFTADQVTITWATRPTISILQVLNQKRSYFKDAGTYVYAIASFANADVQTFSMVDICNKTGVKISKNKQESKSRIGLNLLLRAVNNDSLIITDAAAFIVIWIL